MIQVTLYFFVRFLKLIYAMINHMKCSNCRRWQISNANIHLGEHVRFLVIIGDRWQWVFGRGLGGYGLDGHVMVVRRPQDLESSRSHIAYRDA